MFQADETAALIALEIHFFRYGFPALLERGIENSSTR